MKKVVIGLVGATLDRGQGGERWNQWRPSVSICQHEDLLIDRFELLYQQRFQSLAQVIAEDIRSVSPETEVVLRLVELAQPWDFEEVYGALHDFARSYPFDMENEEYLVHITTGTHVAQICLFLLAEARYIPAKLIQSSPPKRNDMDSPGLYDVIDLDLSKYDRIATRVRQDLQSDILHLKSGIETRNAAFNKLVEEVEHVAMHSTEPILLMGPTGAGKSMLARRIHELKRARAQLSGKFIEVNCATLRGDSALSTLFGHKKGSFTGASQDRQGLLREADQGLLFLDEIGELGLDEQAMLLRAIEEKLFFPMGADKEVGSDFQLICGTNRDLYRDVQAGKFREDLLERINLWTFYFPGLRDRPEDIEPNIEYELSAFARKHSRQIRFSKEAREQFLVFAKSDEAKWSANFRDLNGAITRMATLASGGRITHQTVADEIVRLRRKWVRDEQGREDDGLEAVLGQEKLARLDRFDRVQLAEVVKVCRCSRSMAEAGRLLFAVSRQDRKVSNDSDRLRKYLVRFGLEWADFKELAVPPRLVTDPRR